MGVWAVMEVLRQLWGYPLLRFKIPVGVAYGSDLRLVERLLLQVARENPDVLDDPAPVVRLMAFGDSAIEFELRVWSTTLYQSQGQSLQLPPSLRFPPLREGNRVGRVGSVPPARRGNLKEGVIGHTRFCELWLRDWY
jgi:small-conductance mechanosensitive channel